MGNHNGTIPVDRDKGPGKGTRGDRRVDEAWVSVVAEVQGAQVEEVENEQQLGPAKVGSNEEHDEAKVEEVVDDEVGAHTRSGVHVVGIGGEEVRNVAKLHDEENDPVDVGNDIVHGEGSRVQVVLVPNALTDGVAIVRGVDVVVDGDNEREGPGEKSKDLVGGDGRRAVRLAL